MTMGGDRCCPAVETLHGNVWGTDAVDRTKKASREMTQIIVARGNELQATVAEHSLAAQQQLENGRSLGLQVAQVESAVKVLLDDYNLRCTNMPSPGSDDPLTACAQEHAAAEHLQRAIKTVSALRAIERGYDCLVSAEDGMWSGRGADASTLEAVLQSTPSDSPWDAKAAQAIMSQSGKLRALLAEQLSTAWLAMISVSLNTDGNPEIFVQHATKLSRVRAPRQTAGALPVAASQFPEYTSAQLFDALLTLDQLGSTLSDLRSRLLRNCILPYIRHPVGSYHLTTNEHGSRLYNDGAATHAAYETIAQLRTILSFVADTALPTRDSESSKQFLKELNREAFAAALSHVVIPFMPLSVSELPGWLEQLGQFQGWEVSLLGDESGPISAFQQNDVTKTWLRLHGEQQLRKARHFVRVARSAGSQETTVVDERQPEVPKNAHNEAADDGWGFDDDIIIGNAEEPDDSGWGFDEALQPGPSDPTHGSRPIREARKLGRKHGSKPAESNEDAKLAATAIQPVSDVHTTTAPEASLSDGYRVSKWCDDFVAYASTAFEEVTTSQSIKHPSFQQLPHDLSQQLAEVTSFVRATIGLKPTAPSGPEALMLLSNNFHYLAAAFRDEPALSGWSACVSQADRFEVASTSVLDACIDDASSAGLAILAQTQGLQECGNDDTYHACTAAVQEVITRTTEFARQLASILSITRYRKALSRLIESLVEYVLQSILSLDDITALESERLGALVVQVEQLGKLLQVDEVSMLATLIPSWLKVGYLEEILRASLVDIKTLFENGSLVDFSPDQLARLVKALFAESPKREELLARIMGGRSL